MTKREIIDRIMKHNLSARPEFLAGFSPEELTKYLHQLEDVRGNRKHFEARCPIPRPQAGAMRTPMVGV